MSPDVAYPRPTYFHPTVYYHRESGSEEWREEGRGVGVALLSAYAQRIRQERMLPNTYVQPDSYLRRWEKERRDILKFTQATALRTFPLNGNRGLYGFTYRGGNVWLREDLIQRQDKEKYTTDLHESGHTPDERETRYRTDEKLRWLFPEEEKYRTKPPEYLL